MTGLAIMSSSLLPEIESRISQPNNQYSTPSFRACLLLSLIVASHFYKFSKVVIQIVVFFVVMIIAFGQRRLKLLTESNPTLENRYMVSLISRRSSPYNEDHAFILEDDEAFSLSIRGEKRTQKW
jgi:hypothetical protein